MVRLCNSPFRDKFISNGLLFFNKVCINISRAKLLIILCIVSAFYLLVAHYPQTFTILKTTGECSTENYYNKVNRVVEEIKPLPTETWNTDNRIQDSLNRSFEGFSNVLGADRFIVPNIIHFIRFNDNNFTFVDYVVIKAAMRSQRPDYFYIHTDTPGPGNFTGQYWSLIKKDYELWSRIRLFQSEAPTEIFGEKLNKDWQFYHGSDIQRIRILQKYGGIYMDNDVYVVKNLDKYRKFECTISWKRRDKSIGNQVIIAHKNARFLALYLNLYRDYYPEEWYYNAGEKPVEEILFPHPELIHRVDGKFDSDPTTASKIYSMMDFNWRHLDTIHLLSRWFSAADTINETISIKDVTLDHMKKYKYPFGEMVREVVYP